MIVVIQVRRPRTRWLPAGADAVIEEFLLALLGHCPISELSLLSGSQQKLDFKTSSCVWLGKRPVTRMSALGWHNGPATPAGLGRLLTQNGRRFVNWSKVTIRTAQMSRNRTDARALVGITARSVATIGDENAGCAPALRWSARPVKDYQASIEKLRTDAAEAALVRDLATDRVKRDMYSRLHDHLNRLADEVERAMSMSRSERA